MPTPRPDKSETIDAVEKPGRNKRLSISVSDSDASGDTKPATLETGHEIQVPPFVEEGELVRIDTRTGSYVERVKE